jgi:hypothetical protein
VYGAARGCRGRGHVDVLVVRRDSRAAAAPAEGSQDRGGCALAQDDEGVPCGGEEARVCPGEVDLHGVCQVREAVAGEREEEGLGGVETGA